MNHARSGVALALLFTLFSETSVFAQPRDDRARVVTSRLLAPCCYQQTLDVHESPLATALRAEVDARLRAGQSPAQVEARLVARYGERVRAVPRDHDPRGYVLALVAVAMAVAAGVLLRATRRWSRPAATAAAPATVPRDALDERLDEELRALED
ncbi:MAG: cytochrome c-type biogenesis protein CcmH [Polyangiales bacterium]